MILPMLLNVKKQEDLGYLLLCGDFDHTGGNCIMLCAQFGKLKFVQILLDLRAQVRTDKRFDLSDMIRDRFAEINVEVRDTPQGVEWGFRQEG